MKTNKKRNWDKVDLDRPFMSHHHTVEVLALNFQDLEIAQLNHTFSVNDQEYRNLFRRDKIEFAVSTVVYIDSSTYTFIHQSTPGSVLDLPADQYVALSNAQINRPEGRQFREKEIFAALITLGIVKVAAKEKAAGVGGITIRKDQEGYVLDYSGLKELRNGKIGSVDRVLDYSEINRVQNGKDEEPPKEH